MARMSLAAARVNARLTQKEAADAIGVSQLSVSLWETGKAEPKLSNVRRLCEVYGLSMEDIFFPERSS